MTLKVELNEPELVVALKMYLEKVEGVKDYDILSIRFDSTESSIPMYSATITIKPKPVTK